jgi:hypothetical protein
MSNLHNAIRRAGGLLTAFQDFIGLEQDAGVERLGETLTPVLDLWAHPEAAYLREEKLVGYSIASAAVAGELSAAALVNPTSSGKLIVVERVTTRQGGVASVFLASATEAVIAATLALVGNGEVADTRWTRTTTGVFYTGSDPAVVSLNSVDRILSIANEDVAFPIGLPFILSPGFGLLANDTAANTILYSNWRWRERRAFPGELTS